MRLAVKGRAAEGAAFEPSADQRDCGGANHPFTNLRQTEGTSNGSGTVRMASRLVALARCVALCALVASGAGGAWGASLFPGGAVQPLIVRAAPHATGPDATGSGGAGLGGSGFAGSLFDGPARGLFAPLPERYTGPLRPTWRGPVAELRDLIAAAEAGPDGYDAVQHGARIRPATPPTEMTLAEILRWIRDTPGQPHAIGRYQIIPSTLRHLIEKEGLDLNRRYDPALQDRLADVLMTEAGLQVFLAGEMTRSAFMDRLARVWAGLPTADGRSHYHGYAGNKATIARGRFAAEMARIFPGAS